MGAKIFGFDDYKGFLEAKVGENRATAGYKARLAKAMAAPQSFVSQVLHTHVHLSLDHGLKLATYWGLSDDERDYFLDLVQLARASSPELRALLGRRLGQLRKRNEDLSVRLKQPPKLEDTETQWIYYSSWQMAAVHLLLMTPEHRTPEALAARLRVPVSTIEWLLLRLESIGLVRRTVKQWESLQSHLHLSRTSPVSPVNHLIWRHRAIDDLYADPAGSQGMHYTVLLTLSRADIEKVKETLRAAIENVQRIVAPSREEELICFSCDVFQV